MASTRQIAANKGNASLPRGPLSEAAAAAIRENPLKHGLTAKHVVLSFEDFTGYHDLRASIVMEYLPKTPQEHRLADQVAQSYWRLLRSRRVETATFENRLGSLKSRLNVDPKAPIDNDEGLSICMSNHAKDFDTLRRYETAIERAWYRAIRELRAAQKERRQLEAEQAEEEAYNPPLEDTIAERSEIAANAQTNPTPSSQPDDEIQGRTIKAKVFDIGIRCVSKSSNTDTKISEQA
jgi:hypothetical protein